MGVSKEPKNKILKVPKTAGPTAIGGIKYDQIHTYVISWS
jgi:hypothetical protein